MKNNLFTTASFGDEIYQAMEKQLVSNQVGKQLWFQQIGASC